MSMPSSVAASINVLISKVTRIFDVFDLSFFVSGGACMLALGYLRYVYRSALPYPSGALAVAAALAGSYILGLVCFAAGRWLRRAIFGRREGAAREARLLSALRAHGLDRTALMAPYIMRKAKPWDSYTRLWVELREADGLKESFDLLRSYWVRAAIYDGLVCALVLWAGAIGLSIKQRMALGDEPILAGGLLALLGVGVAVCLREAGRLDHYQIDELVATLTHARSEGGAKEAAQRSGRAPDDRIPAPSPRGEDLPPSAVAVGEVFLPSAGPPAASNLDFAAIERRIYADRPAYIGSLFLFVVVRLAFLALATWALVHYDAGALPAALFTIFAAVYLSGEVAGLVAAAKASARSYGS